MKKYLLLIPLVAFGLVAYSWMAGAQVTNNDPCLLAFNQPKLSAPVAVATSTTAAVLTSRSSTVATRVCSMDVMGGASATWKLEYGSGTLCGTGTTALTGTYPASSNVKSPQGGTQFMVPAGKDLCVLETGGLSVGGYIAYLVQ